MIRNPLKIKLSDSMELKSDQQIFYIWIKNAGGGCLIRPNKENLP